ncbi:MAG: HEAT repeat domain-containing protein [Candidatus Aminicenantes bacterium]|nr:HEAT repeat domain-containing protein [Candidatus Aminicenantes bacterium]
MKCNNIKDKIPDYLTGELEDSQRRSIQDHIAECLSCREELEEMTATWTRLGVLDEEQPSRDMRTKFYAMLETYKKEAEQKKTEEPRRSFGEWLSLWWPKRPAAQFALSATFLLVGLIGGFFIQSGSFQAQTAARLNEEIQSMRRTLAVSLMNQPSASERIKGINTSYDLEKPGAETIEMLLQTLNSDPNINVRLAAVDALYLFYNQPGVRDGLMNSLAQQTSPLVQVSLIDLLVDIRERKAVDAFRRLINKEELIPAVKEKAEEGIQKLSF